MATLRRRGVTLIIVVLGVATVLDIVLNKGASVGSLLVLAATAMIVVWYTEETRRLADSTADLALQTKCMAEGTRAMAQAAVSPGLVLEAFQAQTGGQLQSKVINMGPGAAYEVVVKCSTGTIAVKRLAPGASVSEQKLAPAFHKGQGVTLSCRDALGNEHLSSWEFSEKTRSWHVTA